MSNLKDNSVTQDNQLINATYRMGLDEKRLLCAAISKLNPESKAWKDGRAEIEISAKEWGALYNLDGVNPYKQLNEASKALYDRSIKIYGDSDEGKEMRVLSARQYSKRSGCVSITFSGPILYYLSSLYDQFTTYDLLGVSGLKSIYSIRMYELASQFKDTGWRHLSLKDIRKMFDLGDNYQSWSDMRKRVVDRAVKEVSAKSDLDLSYKPVKEGRSVVAIKLKIQTKPQIRLL